MTIDADDPVLKRTLWRAEHRGMREMDLLLGPFARAHLAAMAPAAREDFLALLDIPDQTAFSWMVGTIRPEPRFAALVAAIRAHAAAHPIAR